MTTKRRRLLFPILRSLRIGGYQLYPGAGTSTDPGAGFTASISPGIRDTGFEHEFVPGLTVIIGINGLGKTTLLNALFRMLSGPVDWNARREDAPAGSTPTTLGEWRNPSYFRRRVADDAVRATMTARVDFGKHVIELTRSLRDLSLVSLTVDGKERKTTEEMYRATVAELSGIESFDDFFLVLRYLVFFLEERQPIVWDASAQSDVLRVLFFDADSARESRRLFDNVQQADSRFRNIRVPLNRMERQLNAAREAASGDPAAAAEFSGLKTRMRALEDEERDLDIQVERADEERKSNRLRLELARHTLEERQVAYAVAEQQHVAHVFPGIDTVAEYVFTRASGGCLVCGSRTGAAQEHIRTRLRAHRCPLCDSAAEQQENIVTSGQVDERRLQKLDDEAMVVAENVRALEAALTGAVTTYRALLERLLKVQGEIEDLRLQLKGRAARLPPDAGEVEDLDTGIKRLRAEARHWERARQLAEAEFRTVLEQGERKVRAQQHRIAERFSHFVRDFIGEQCDIEYSTEERRIGQEGERFPFPRFTVRLTSAVTPDEPQPRHNDLDVSESQREFIDLSFRMALLEVAADKTPLMLVLETPEASLDALFMARAGGLLGEFARANPQNRVIASSNLTKGEMISALLGTLDANGEPAGDSPPDHFVAAVDRPKHIINLLRIAAPNAALRDYRAAYERTLDQAVYPEVPSGGRKASRRGRR